MICQKLERFGQLSCTQEQLAAARTRCRCFVSA
jgi:hypothetical protein